MKFHIKLGKFKIKKYDTGAIEFYRRSEFKKDWYLWELFRTGEYKNEREHFVYHFLGFVHRRTDIIWIQRNYDGKYILYERNFDNPSTPIYIKEFGNYSGAFQILLILAGKYIPCLTIDTCVDKYSFSVEGIFDYKTEWKKWQDKFEKMVGLWFLEGA